MKPLAQENAIERAKRLNTYQRVDRSKQYEGRYSPESLLRDLNYAHRNIRERTSFRNKLILTVVAAVLARLPEIVGFLHRLMQ